MADKKPKIEKYGLSFPATWTPAQIELTCMLHDHPIEAGGLGRYGHLRNALICLWPQVYAGDVEPGVPKMREDVELILQAVAKYKFVMVLGHASAGKTHTAAHIAAAFYMADCLNTIITLTSTHLPGLRQRLWADVVEAINSSTMGKIFDVRTHDMTIRPAGTLEDKYVIGGIATNKGDDAVEKIQGTHSRNARIVVIDEAQGTPKAIFDAAANLSADPLFLMLGLANPTDKNSEFGSWCEPVHGWESINPETDIQWETKRGGVCIRLDGARSANIRLGRVVFPFLIRPDFVQTIETSFGQDSPRWWTYFRGWFAPDGSVGSVVHASALSRAQDVVDFSQKPVRCAAFDPAFEGGDDAILSLGEYSPVSKKLNLLEQKDAKASLKQSASSDPLDYRLAFAVIDYCKENGVSPENFIMDDTGAGRGVAAILEREWGRINRCSFGGAPTTRRLRLKEKENASQLFDRFVSELWWAARVFMEDRMVGGVTTKFRELRTELSSRRYESVKDKKISVETKRDMKKRLGASPDRADSFCLLIELMRRKGALGGSQESAQAADPQKDRERRMREMAKAEINEYVHGAD